MYFTLRRIWGFIVFFIWIAIGSFLATDIGLGDNLGYGLGFVLSIVIWAVGATFISASIGPEKAEKEYLKSLKDATSQLNQGESYKSDKKETIITNFCPNCGKPVTDGDRYCRSCGNSLS